MSPAERDLNRLGSEFGDDEAGGAAVHSDLTIEVTLLDQRAD